jgi:uncharacterized protein (TIGR02270 family)
MPILPAIVEQYAEQAAFLYSQREAALDSAAADLSDLVQLDERLDAHLDGLRIADGDAWAICADALAERLGGEYFTAAVVAFDAGDPRSIDMLLSTDAIHTAPAELISALGWRADSDLHARVRELLRAQSERGRRIALAALRDARQAPTAWLSQAAAADDPLLRLFAAQAAGNQGQVELRPTLLALIADTDRAVRCAAACSLAFLGERETARPVLLEQLRGQDQDCARAALSILPRLLPKTEHRLWWDALATAEHAHRLRIAAVAATGSVTAIPWLIAQVRESPRLARAAGAAISLLTGVDLETAGLVAEHPADSAASPNDDPSDETVALDPDDDRPCPHPEKLAAWWGTAQARYDIDHRYLAGAPIGSGHCRRLLHVGTQPQRAAAALELALNTPDAALFNVRGPSWRQASWLAATPKAR